jgi:hypothetical protein
MPANATTIFLSALDADVEISITFQARRYNGIPSDPRVSLTEPSARELLEALDRLRSTKLSALHLHPQLDYPVA